MRGCTPPAAVGTAAAGASPAHAGMHPQVRFQSPPPPRFPRTRGDAPLGRLTVKRNIRLPPHTRGCTGHQTGRKGHQTASPAHAGMHRSAGASGPPASCFPRTRGDAPPFARLVGDVRELPPHTRGCTAVVFRVLLLGVASPAHAGMHPSTCRSASGPRRFPRTRGDAPLMQMLGGVERSLPPHTRGCTPCAGNRGACQGASPAHAGMHPGAPPVTAAGRGFPRTRGDAPGALLLPPLLL